MTHDRWEVILVPEPKGSEHFTILFSDPKTARGPSGYLPCSGLRYAFSVGGDIFLNPLVRTQNVGKGCSGSRPDGGQIVGSVYCPGQSGAVSSFLLRFGRKRTEAVE